MTILFSKIMADFTCGFSYDHYTEVLELAKKHYKIGPFRDIKNLKNNRFIILRHDVDFSLDRAISIAELEFEQKISSTFFILLHSQYYNALSQKNIRKINQILDLGHEIGLHYDASLANSGDQLSIMIKSEIDLLYSMIKEKIVSIAPHNTSINKNFKMNEPSYSNITSPQILKFVTYLSDSVQNWRKGCMCNHIMRENKLMILTHPIWWSKKSASREIILLKFEDYLIKNLRNNFNETKKMHKAYLKGLKKGTIE